MLHDLVRARRRASHVLEVLPHQTIATARVGCVDNGTLFGCFSRGVSSLGPKEMALDLLVTGNVFAAEQIDQIVHRDQDVRLVLD